MQPGRFNHEKVNLSGEVKTCAIFKTFLKKSYTLLRRQLFFKMLKWQAIFSLFLLAHLSFGQCPTTITANYCNLPNGQIQLTATAAGTTYTWNTGQTGSTISVPGAGIYTVTVTGNGCNTTTSINVGDDLVVNGNFDAGNTGFNSMYTHTSGLINEQGLYKVGTRGSDFWNGIFYGYDHTVNDGLVPHYYLGANGADDANVIIWMETVNVVANTDYYFSIYALDLLGQYSTVTHQVQVDMNIVLPTSPTPTRITQTNILPWGTRNDTNNAWNHYTMAWNSGAFSGPIQITISTPFIEFVGNNAGLDDISFSRLNPVPMASGSGNISVCPGNTINLTSSVTGGSAPFTYSWTGPNGFTSNVKNPSGIPNATTEMSGTYTVTVTDYFGCIKTGTVNVSVTSGITNLTATATENPICAGESINLSSSADAPVPFKLINENFNGSTNWTTSNSSSGGTSAYSAWAPRPDGWITNSLTFHSNDNSQFYLSDSRSQNGSSSSLTDTRLTSPVINTMGYSTLSLDFYQYFRLQGGLSNERATVEVSTNGTTWTIVATYTSTQGASNAFAHPPAINLNAYINNPTLQIRFHYYARGRARYWAIDNVTLTGNFNNYLINWTALPAVTGFPSTQANPQNITPSQTTTYTVTYTNQTTGCSESKPITVTVNAAPFITSQPQNVSACGVAATFAVSGTGTSLTYQWYESTAIGGPWTILTNTSPYSGVTTSTLTVNPIASKNGYYYHCVVGNGTACTTTSNPAILTVTGGAPSVSNPSDQSICEGQNASFTISSNGQTFRWMVSIDGGVVYNYISDDATYNGTTSTNLNITGATLSMNSWKYICEATIPACPPSTHSLFPGTLTVTALPTITTHPLSHTICPNTTSTFSVAATGATSYQWQVDTGTGFTDVTNTGVYSGATSSILTLEDVPLNYNGYQYRCNVIAASSCSAMSNTATLSFTFPPTISVQPADQYICELGTAAFDVTAVSTVGLNFQWQENRGTGWNSLSNGGAYSGTQTANLTITAPPLSYDNYQYQCIVTDVVCSQTAISDPSFLNFKQKPVTSPPIDATVCEGFGLSATFRVDPLPGVTYQWQVSTNGGGTWTDLTVDQWGAELGVTSSLLRVWTPDFSKNGYQYNCILTLDGCSNPSGAAELSISPAPFINYTPPSPSLNYCTGSSVTITAIPVNPIGSYEYLWFKDNVSTGITTQNITIKSILDGGLGPGSYNARATNPLTGCEFYRVPVIVTELPAGLPVSVSIVATPSTPICQGTNVRFDATPTNGGTAPVYQWKKNGLTVGGNFSFYNDIALINGDVITCVLTSNAVCAQNNPATSNAIATEVNPIETVNVSISTPDPTTICPNTSITFTATLGVGVITPVTYQWKKSGSNVGTNSPTYTDPGLISGAITCVVTSSNPCATGNPTSFPINITVNSPAVFNVTGGITCYFGGSGPPIGVSNAQVGATYWLVLNGTDIDSRTRGIPNAFNFGNRTAAGVYTVRAVYNGCSVMMNGSAIIYTPPVITGSSTVCPGKTTQWTGSGTPASVNAWVSGNTNVVNVDNNGLVTGVASGTTSITYTDNNGCSKSKTIQVGDLVTITQSPANKSGCESDQVTFSASYSYSGQVIFNWYRIGTTDAILSGNATSSPIQLILNNIGSDGNVNGSQYRLEIGPSEIGCMVSSESAKLTVNTLPICSITGGLDTICAGSTTTWSATAGITSYSWSGPDGFTASTQNITIGLTGTYSVTIRDANGCQSTCSRTLNVNPLPTTSAIYHR